MYDSSAAAATQNGLSSQRIPFALQQHSLQKPQPPTQHHHLLLASIEGATNNTSQGSTSMGGTAAGGDYAPGCVDRVLNIGLLGADGEQGNNRSLFIFSENNLLRKAAKTIIDWGYPFPVCSIFDKACDFSGITHAR